MHHDEANQALRCKPLLSEGLYRYESFDHHGPTLYYLAAPLLLATCGRNFDDCTEIALRSVTALAGIAVMLLLLPLRNVLGGTGLAAAMACVALSPGLVYFSRFFIQEMILVALTAGLLTALWRYACLPSRRWAIAIGLAVGLMIATKETAVLTFAALILAAAATCQRSCWRRPTAHLLWAFATAVVVLGIFYTSFFSNWRGPVDLIAAIPIYLNRAGGGGHDHPWWWYFRPLTQHEWPILLLALTGLIAAWQDRSDEPRAVFLRLVAVAAPLLLAFYSLIHYKTPWCVMSPLFLFTILAGHGFAILIRAAGAWRFFTVWPMMGAALMILGLTAWQLSLSPRVRSDAHNWYAYVETSSDLLNMLARIERLASQHPQGRSLPVAVVSPGENIWPLPWYLRRYRQVGYWTSAAEVPGTFLPDLVIGSAEESEPVARRLGPDRHEKYYGLRPGVLILLYCRSALWQQALDTTITRKP